jgi:hypothetical protein
MTARVMALFKSKDADLAHLIQALYVYTQYALFPCTIKVDAECDG